jgi:hypothetical protein
MTSIRELIVRDVVARCQAAVSPATVVRQPTVALTREQTPALIVTVVSDAPVKRSNDRVERELALRLTGLARDLDDGFAVADDLICRVHQALLLDRTLGGLALDLAEMECEVQAEDADAEAIAIPAQYRITYRVLAHDISQKG